ncbi:hypothetical protein WDU94_010295 [Cyamophila willieti]
MDFNEDDFLSKFIMSDEAHFHLSEYVNKQNYRFWGTENPRICHEEPLLSLKVTVWCGVYVGKVTGRYSFEDDVGNTVNVDGERYRAMDAMVNEFLLPQLDELGLENMWFQQDGATAHTARATIDLLKQALPGRLISRFGDIHYSARSPDLSVLDFFLLGFLKSRVYATLKTETESLGRITYTPRFTHNHDPIVLPKKKKMSLTTKKRSSSVKSIDSTYGTLRAQDMSLPNQITSLIQEIVTKQMEIDKLNEKSNEDQQTIQNMLHRIRTLEDMNKMLFMTSDSISSKSELQKLSEESLARQPEEVFDVLCKLGEGSYGSVYKALHKESGQVLAIKQVPVDTDLQEIIKEISIMQQCDSPYVVKYYGSYFKNTDLWIVMEYCGAGSVSDIMRLRKKTLSEDEIATILCMNNRANTFHFVSPTD